VFSFQTKKYGIIFQGSLQILHFEIKFSRVTALKSSMLPHGGYFSVFRLNWLAWCKSIRNQAWLRWLGGSFLLFSWGGSEKTLGRNIYSLARFHILSKYEYKIFFNYAKITLFGCNQSTVFFSHTKPSPATASQQYFFSQQISTSHQPQPAEQSVYHQFMSCLVPNKFSTVPVTSNVQTHEALNAVEKINNYTV